MTDEKKTPAETVPLKNDAAADPDGERNVIQVDTPEYDPTLDPQNPAFNPAKWKAATEEAAERLQQTFLKTQKTLTEAVQPILQTATRGDMISDSIRTVADAIKESQEGITQLRMNLFPTFKGMQEFFNSFQWQSVREALENITETARPLLAIAAEMEELAPFLEEELKKPVYEGMGLDDLMNSAETDGDGHPLETSLFMQALNAARAARDAAEVIKAQQAGRDQRRVIKENALASGAIMGLHSGNLVTFSERDLWDAFAPGRISKIGTLARDKIDEETGELMRDELENGDIIPVSAIEVSYKALLLLNTILANSVENYRERFVKDGAITFYVKGVLDSLEIDPRIKDDGQLDINRKTAGVLYLENQFAPLLHFVGTIPDGSRYSVFNYDGYDVNTDTMTIRTPYLFQLWKRTQIAFAQRKTARQKRIDAGKKPLKKDLKPLELNTLFKPSAYKEDDAVLEIATYITNVLLSAGAGAHKTDIAFKTMIKNCSRLREKLDEIDRLPNGAVQENGKRINKAARYNSELRKIARAYSLIMNPDKCDALRYFSFESFLTIGSDGAVYKFMPPTKSTLDGKISIKWRKIDPEKQ